MCGGQGRRKKKKKGIYIVKGNLGFITQEENYKTSPLDLGYYQIEKGEK